MVINYGLQVLGGLDAIEKREAEALWSNQGLAKQHPDMSAEAKVRVNELTVQCTIISVELCMSHLFCVVW